MRVVLDLSDNIAAQDMISIIMRSKGLTSKCAVTFSINDEMYLCIKKTGWASIAYSAWGHGDPDRKWEKLDNPIIEIGLDESQMRLVDDVAKSEDIDVETAVCYFLIFTMQSLGYHI